MSSRRRSLRRLASTELEELPSPRPRRAVVQQQAHRADANIDNLKEDDNDDEYTEDKIEEDDEEEEEVEKSLQEEEEDDDDDDDVEEDDDDDDEEIRVKKRSRSRSSQPVEEDVNKKHKPSPKIVATSTTTTNVKEDSTADLEIVNDEYDLPIDPHGELKVNSNGELMGGRQYRIKTFTVHGKESRLYMLSTELARLMGFRDSYLFFQRHKKLYKYITTDKQKLDLVERQIMPLSYKLRTIGLITARSAFREFGAKIIQNGKQVIDDYYEQRARDDGGVEGEYAIPPQEYHPGGSTVGNNELSGLSSNSRQDHHHHNHNQHHAKESSSIEYKKFIRSTPENWIYNIATSTVHLNHFYNTSRPKFVKDLYTNVKFIPSHTQPSRVDIHRLSDSTNGELVFDTKIIGDFKKRKFGLSNVDDSIFIDCVDDEVKNAIIRQRDLERSLNS